MSDILHSVGWKHLQTTTTFYGWLDVREVSHDDEQFSLRLAQETGVLTFPGSYFSSPHVGVNPGTGFIRIALIDSIKKTKVAVTALAQFYSLNRGKK
jgi:N-succinyldiaminopimelate aminotransferase